MEAVSIKDSSEGKLYVRNEPWHACCYRGKLELLSTLKVLLFFFLPQQFAKSSKVFSLKGVLRLLVTSTELLSIDVFHENDCNTFSFWTFYQQITLGRSWLSVLGPLKMIHLIMGVVKRNDQCKMLSPSTDPYQLANIINASCFRRVLMCRCAPYQCFL